jgi:Carboxypeptidase regulatory-like domain
MSRLRNVFVALSITAAVGLLPAASALAAGSISGTATAAGTGAPIAGLSVCAEANFVGGVASGCTATDAAGNYTIGGLPARSDYQVEFSALGNLNFLTQYFQGKEGLDNWDRVAVNDGATTAGINAAMNPGAQISGHVGEQGTEAAAEGVEVCALDPAPNPRAEEFERCAKTDGAGNYVVRSLPGGTYVIVFARYRPPVDSVPFAQQYYANATTKQTATPISLAPPETRAGIDASLVNRLQVNLFRAPGFRTVTRHRGVRLGFRFHAQVPVGSFICKRDRGPWRACRSPHRFWAPLGRHAFRVRAISLAGDKGPITLNRFRVTLSPSSRRGAR